MSSRRPLLLASLGFVCALLACPVLAQNHEEVEGTSQHPLEPPDTSSPRATLESFLAEANAVWSSLLGSDEGERRNTLRAALAHARRAGRCLDLSQVPPAQLEETRVQTVVLLLDVLNRIEIPAPGQIPDTNQMDAEAPTGWTLPHTRITIARVEEGPRAGEWLFTAGTVERAKEFYRRTRVLPLKPGAEIEDGYELYVSIPGWMIPLAWVEALPGWAKEVYFEQAVWQWALVTVLLAITVGAGFQAVRWSRRAPPGEKAPTRRALVGPVTLVLLTAGAGYLVGSQVGLTGTVYNFLRLAFSSVLSLAAAWSVMLLGGLVAESLLSSPHIRPGSVDAQIVRLASRLVALAVAVFILIEGARSLGLPVVGVIAGLGVGGLAVALAAQSTLENFIGSLTIFADRPVRVGDFCRFGDQMGTVEEIGVRSTRIRTLDRSVLTVPNAEFSRLKIENLTLRDRILFRTTVNLRLETSSDQLRLVLARLRELLLGHPRVDEEPARVRVAALGPSSIDLEVFAYVTTSDFNEFLAIREDLFLRMMDVVEQAGTCFAPPARTSYVAPNPGLDEERARNAEAQVKKWRSESTLPFPEFAPEQREKISDTLDFPPAGSPDGPPPRDEPRG
jgi:MscS family membrane protein